jgi:hypothetical protein
MYNLSQNAEICGLLYYLWLRLWGSFFIDEWVSLLVTIS